MYLLLELKLLNNVKKYNTIRKIFHIQVLKYAFNRKTLDEIFFFNKNDKFLGRQLRPMELRNFSI